MTEAHAFWTVAVGRGEIHAENLCPQPGSVRVRALASGISRGTESLIFAGRVPSSQYEVMRAPLMAGAFPFPVKYGYSAVGLTVDLARVFVLHPHQNLFDAPGPMCIAVPAAVTTERAVLAANMETALNILWDSRPLAGERILVIGAGVVGLLTAALCARIPATKVTVVDIDPRRERLAQQLGCKFALPDAAPGEQELIVHASASEAGLRLALARAAFEARIVEASWFGDRAPALPLGEAFHARRLRIVATQVGAVSPAMRGRRSYADRLGTALELLADPVFDLLLDQRVAFKNMPAEMPRLLASGLCHVITYES
ncbi:MAG: zinc-binding alcohol dehydrogenase [Acetobacteraceae bacterium]|nr:zinc-binding alcohol dehydrogenase [Acetobacteraceae bacterium]MSP29456.1 zinc-binding alcohol dehydrogenase [Acetobacteraceae bacterium]